MINNYSVSILFLLIGGAVLILSLIAEGITSNTTLRILFRILIRISVFMISIAVFAIGFLNIAILINPTSNETINDKDIACENLGFDNYAVLNGYPICITQTNNGIKYVNIKLYCDKHLCTAIPYYDLGDYN